MTEQELRGLMERGRAAIDVPPAPTDLLERGRARRGRRRTARAGLGAGLVAAAAVTALLVVPPMLGRDTTPAPDPGPAPTTPVTPPAPDDGTTLPPAPAGTRWVGVNGIVVTAPRSWLSVECIEQGGDVLLFAPRRPVPPETCSWSADFPLRIASRDAALFECAEPGCKEARELPGGVEAWRLQTLSSHAPLVVPSRDVVISVWPGLDGGEDILGSARVLPPGWVTVPRLPLDPSPARSRPAMYLEQLRSLGLRTRVVEVDQPVWVSSDWSGFLAGVEPSVGAAVREGSTVTVRVFNCTPCR